MILKKISNVLERKVKVIENNLCINCLHYGHFEFNCPNEMSCKYCNERHHSVLHPYSKNQRKSTAKFESNSQLSSQSKNNSNVDPHSQSKCYLKCESELMKDSEIKFYSESDYCEHKQSDTINREMPKINVSN